MKKGIFCVLFFLLTVSVVSAGPGFMNFTATHANHWFGDPNVSTNILGLNVVAVTNYNLYWGAGFGFGLSFEQDGTTTNIADIKDYSTFIVNGMLGYGRDISWKNIGIVLGGGIMLDWHVNTYSSTEQEIISETQYYYAYRLNEKNTSSSFISLGLVFTPYFYIDTSAGFLINIGALLAWTPLAFNVTGNEDMKFNASQLQAGLHIGIGYNF